MQEKQQEDYERGRSREGGEGKSKKRRVRKGRVRREVKGSTASRL